MKKFFVVCMLFVVSALSANCAEKYAFVNIDAVMNAYPEAKSATEWLKNEEIKIQKFVVNARADLDKTPEASRKDKENKYNGELQKMTQNLKTQEAAKAQKIYADFNAAVQKVAKRDGYSLVVPTALYGAKDITPDVIKAMKK